MQFVYVVCIKNEEYPYLQKRGVYVAEFIGGNFYIIHGSTYDIQDFYLISSSFG